ncbi:hypothetical protein [Burkholderia ambifaria]|uniref:hypothetical protein n=1 Tax=Burkholderia ambifaria TaxID=152480 RepID=UPI0011B1F08C|nr:hypothetical protein [Burkholderia ambifaria]
MPIVYTGFSHNGGFIAFWKSDSDTLSYFRPTDPYEKYGVADMREWESIRQEYVDEAEKESDSGYDFLEYDDILNAAWHYIGQHGDLILKKEFKPSKLKPGTYFPRIWRGYYNRNDLLGAYLPIGTRAVYGRKHVQSTVAASSLFSYLIEIFRHIEPATSNFKTFSHKLRELLILTCTEIESSWRAVLTENAPSIKNPSRTSDYIKIKEPLRLDEWSVVLSDYPDTESFSPFREWNATSPTQSLRWYNAYNAVKHNRELEFEKATLEHLLNAMAALHIMQVAQWGPQLFDTFHDNCFSPFRLVQSPEFGASDMYLPSLDGSGSFVQTPYFP